MSYGVHKVTPIHGIMWEKSKFFVTLQKSQENVKVKTTGFVHKFIIPANCWNHYWRSKSNSSMSHGVHKVTPIHGTICKSFRDLERFNELWGPQNNVSDAWTDGRMDSQYYQVPTGVSWGTKHTWLHYDTSRSLTLDATCKTYINTLLYISHINYTIPVKHIWLYYDIFYTLSPDAVCKHTWIYVTLFNPHINLYSWYIYINYISTGLFHNNKQFIQLQEIYSKTIE